MQISPTQPLQSRSLSSGVPLGTELQQLRCASEQRFYRVSPSVHMQRHIEQPCAKLRLHKAMLGITATLGCCRCPRDEECLQMCLYVVSCLDGSAGSESCADQSLTTIDSQWEPHLNLSETPVSVMHMEFFFSKYRQTRGRAHGFRNRTVFWPLGEPPLG